MKTIILGIIIATVFFSISCRHNTSSKEPKVRIETSMGNIVVKLYNETPIHRDNFLKLVNDNFFDGVLFHRVINQFMIQAGDPGSKNAQPGILLGEGGPGYDIPAEIRPGLFHKKGVLAAAREGDETNPERKSSGSQFYLAQGKVFNDEQLDKEEQRINNLLINQIVFQYIWKPENVRLKARMDSLLKINDNNGLNALTAEIQNIIAPQFTPDKMYKIPEQQREVYKTIGGIPHLDQNYTIFGEIVEGLEVVDKIAAVNTDKNDRPVLDVKIIKMTVIE